MYVSDLALDDFRSYDELVLALQPGPTAFVGPNGQGKTNLVEAIAYLSTLSSHRVGADTALVRRAAPGQSQPGGAVVRAKAVHGDRPSVLEIEIIAGKANRARLNRGVVRPRELLGILRAVVFAPEDLSLVREEPGVRRRFLERVSQGQSAAHLAYRSSLLLHEGHAEPDPSDDMAVVAAETALVDVSSTARRLETAMSELRDREIDRGANLIGAHRDDLVLHVGALPAKGFASHGEQWSLALALRLASYEMLRHDVDAYGGDGEPVLILDDVFASLDAGRRAALAGVVVGAQQALLTAAVDEDIPAELDAMRFSVSASGVSRG